MNHPITDKIRDRYGSEYKIFEHEHDIALWNGTHPHYVELQYGGDMTLVVVRRRRDGVNGQDPLVGMPYTCGPEEDEIFDRLERALETVEYHNQ